MYIFGCLDTTTVVMDYLTRQEIKPLLCLNKDFNNIRNNGYHSIRVVQDFIKKNKKLKCHENRYNCKKISLKELYQHSSKYIGKTIQFILSSNQKSYQKCFHNILWHCKLVVLLYPITITIKIMVIMVSWLYTKDTLTIIYIRLVTVLIIQAHLN